MSHREDIDVIFTEYVAAQRAGDYNPRPFLARTDGRDREVLSTMIDAYLTKVPGREWDPEAFKGSPAEKLVAPMTRAICGVSGTWPVLLPSLRHKAKIKRRDLVEKLADGLGYPAKSKVVAEYYHDMEHGDLPSEGVSGKVLEVLSGILDTGVDTLQHAGHAIGGGEYESDHVVFARQSNFPQPEQSHSDAMVSSDAQRSPAQPDEDEIAIDRLFTGGGG